MEICRSRFIAHVPINAADAELYMNVKVIIVVIHSNMVNVYYAMTHFEMRRHKSLPNLQIMRTFQVTMYSTREKKIANEPIIPDHKYYLAIQITR